MMDSERPIEKMLRASAEKRRAEAGAPFELHPATRRLLQGEVVRTHRTAANPRPEKPWFRALWLRVGGAVATIAIVGLAARMVWNSEKGPGESVQLANTTRDESMAGASAVGESRGAVEASPRAAVPEPSRSSLEPSASESESARARLESAPSPAFRSVPAAPSPALGEAAGALYARRSASPPPDPAPKVVDRDNRDDPAAGLSLADSTVTSSAPASTLATPSLEVAKSAGVGDGILKLEPSTMGRSTGSFGGFDARKEKVGETTDLPEQSERFGGLATVAPTEADRGQAQLFRNQIASEGKQILARGGGLQQEVQDRPREPEAVLASFSVENTGREMRITDKDGSVYAGPVRLTNQQVLGIAAFSAAPPQAGNFSGGGGAGRSAGYDQKDLLPAQAPQYYWFHVTGTNRTLNRRIEFEGNLAQNLDRSVVANNQSYGLGLSNNSLAITNQQPVLWQNQSVISGRVVIDGKTEMNVNAQSAP